MANADVGAGVATKLELRPRRAFTGGVDLSRAQRRERVNRAAKVQLHAVERKPLRSARREHPHGCAGRTLVAMQRRGGRLSVSGVALT